MSILVSRRLLFALFFYSFLACPRICVADNCEDIDLQYNFWTAYSDMTANEIKGILYVTLTWKHPNVPVKYYHTFRNGSRSPVIGGGSSYIWQLYRRYYKGPNRHAQFEAAVEEVLDSSHTFGIQVVVDDGDDIFCTVYYEPPPETAWEPRPADGSVAGERTTVLAWEPGSRSVSHDVYFGDSFADVNDGTGGTFYGNRTVSHFAVGFGESASPDGLEAATTYYWRVDEIQKEAKYKGTVWSFTTPGQTSYAPVPADRAKFLDTDVDFAWTTGFGAVLHDVYLGADLAQVRDADVLDGSGTYLGRWAEPSYRTGGLDRDRTYFWRVDEVEADGETTHKGDIWSFMTAGLGGGVKGDYFRGVDITNHVLSRIDPQIDFNLGNDAPDNVVGGDNFSVVWTGEVEAAFTERYTFYTNSDDGVRLWVDGWSVVDNWSDHRLTENKGTVDLVGGRRHFLEMWWYDRNGDAVAELLWESPRTPKQIVPQAALSPPFSARSPSPTHGAIRGRAAHILSWIAGDQAMEHDVYFGTDLHNVSVADTSDGTGTYRGRQAATSYVTEELGSQMYYWRIDEVDADGITVYKSDVWTFTVADVVEQQLQYQVSSSEDDGYAINRESQNLSLDFLKVGDSTFTKPPYYKSGMIFRGVSIPQGADIISAHLSIRAHSSHLTAAVYGKIAAEATNDAATVSDLQSIGSVPATGPSVDWVLSEPWSEGVWYDSPNIADVIRGIVTRPGWSAGNSLAILYSTWWANGGYRNFSSFDADGSYAPKLVVTYIAR